MLTGAPPFYSKDRNKMYKNILEKPLDIKPYFSPDAASFLQGLLCIEASKRLGAKEGAREIKNHPFFANLNWDLL